MSEPMPSPSPLPPHKPRASARLGLFSLIGMGVAAVSALFIVLGQPAPMTGMLRALMVLALLLVPAALLLALVAIGSNVVERRRARRDPERCLSPGRSGLGTAILSLALGVVACGLLLPLLLGGNHGRVRDKVVFMYLQEGMAGLGSAFAQARQEGRPVEERRAPMEAWLATLGDRRNPWRRSGPAIRTALVVAGRSPEETRQRAVAEARTLGEVVFVLSEPGPERCLAGAVLTQGLFRPSPGFPDVSVVPSGEGQILVRSVLLAD